jgi:TolA-binding protein
LNPPCWFRSYQHAQAFQLENKDIYRLGYSYLKIGKHEKAIEQFTRVTDKQDTTSQFAHFHLAECYIKTDKKPSARLAFDRAYKLKFDKEIT